MVFFEAPRGVVGAALDPWRAPRSREGGPAPIQEIREELRVFELTLLSPSLVRTGALRRAVAGWACARGPSVFSFACRAQASFQDFHDFQAMQWA
eukprot:3831006-Pyramimonas_sp.AAC.1